jgi:hypothetical protein
MDTRDGGDLRRTIFRQPHAAVISLKNPAELRSRVFEFAGGGMFSSELDRVRHPLQSRGPGILLGSIVMIALTAAIVGPRTLAFTYWIVVAGFLLAAALRGDIEFRQVRPGPVAISFAAFLLYALLSAFWAIQPEVALTKASMALAIAASALLIWSMLINETRANLLHMGEGVCIGLLLGLLYLLIELLTDQSIKLWLYRAIRLGPEDLNPRSFFKWDGRSLMAISKDDVTRSIAPAVLFLWPTLMIIRGAWPTPWRTAGGLFLVLLATVVVMISWHESSKLALVAGLGAFMLSWLSARWAARLLLVGWVCTCMAVVPAALLAHRLHLHQASWLQDSARHRIIIWNFTAEKTLESPWLGVGANMTYVLGPEIESETPILPGETLKRTLSIHSHSIYLQTWFELGLVGAVLLTLVGLSVLGAIRWLDPFVQPYAYATFATAAALAGASYGMWQYWFMALFGFCAVASGVGVGLLTHPQRCERPASTASS